MPENESTPTIRVTKVPNLDVILSSTGYEPYAAKRLRITELLEAGEKAQREARDE